MPPQLQRLLAHLLKWRYPRPPSWDTTIDQAREVDRHAVIQDNPSLREQPPQRLPLAYRRARTPGRQRDRLPADDVAGAVSVDAGPAPRRGFFPEGLRQTSPNLG